MDWCLCAEGRYWLFPLSVKVSMGVGGGVKFWELGLQIRVYLLGICSRTFFMRGKFSARARHYFPGGTVRPQNLPPKFRNFEIILDAHNRQLISRYLRNKDVESTGCQEAQVVASAC